MKFYFSFCGDLFVFCLANFLIGLTLGIPTGRSERVAVTLWGVSRLKLLSTTSGTTSLVFLQMGSELMALSVSQSSLSA